MADEELRAKITLDAQSFSVGVGEIVSKLAALESAIAGVGSKLENNLDKSLGQVNNKLQGLSLDVVANKLSQAAESMKAAFSEVVTPAVDFQTAMLNVNTVAKLSDEQLSALTNQMRTLGQTIGIGIAPTEAAAAQYDILSAGFTNAADATEILTQAAIASKGGLTTTAAAADLLTSALNSYGVGADQAKRFNDVLFTGVEKGKIRFEDFVAGLGQVAPAAAANNVSIEELSAAMAALTAAGQQPARAFTGLNAAIVQLSSPTKEARDAAAGLGIDLEGAAFRGLSLVEKLQLLATTAGENKSALRKVLGDVNALGVAYSLTGNGAKTYADALAATTGPSNAAANAAKINEQGVAAAQKRFEAAADALKIAVSEAILPALAGFADAGTKAIQFLDSFSPLAKAAAGIVLGIGTAATITAGAIGATIISVRGLAFGLGVQIPTASTLATGALARISGAALAARTSILAMNAAALAGPLGLLLLGAGAIKAAMDFAELKDSAVAAADAIETVGAKALPGGSKQSASTGAILATPVADLKKQGIDQTDVQNRIRELRETREDALAAGDKALVAKLDDKIKQLIAVREKLDAPAKPGSASAGPSDAVKNFKLSPPVDEKTIEERRKQALFEIENSKLVGEERIKALEAFMAREKLAGDERRAIEQKIFQERKKLEDEAGKAAKKAADDAKADALQAIDLSKASHAQKIQQLSALATKYKEDADLRRTINRQIAQEEEAAAKDLEDKRKKRADDAKKAEEDAKEQASEVRGAQQDAAGLRKDSIDGELEKAKEKGQKSNVQALLNERQRLTEETIRLQLAEQLANTQSAEARVQLERNAEERIRQERQKTADEFKKFTDDQIAAQKKLDDAKKPKPTSTEFTGGLLTPEEMAKQLNDRFGGGAGNDDFEARRAATQAKRQAALSANLAALSGAGKTGLLGPGSTAFVPVQSTIAKVAASVPTTVSKLKGLPDQGAPAIKLDHTININVTYPDGQTQTQRVSIPGVPGPAQGGHGSVSFSPRGRA